MARKPKGIRPWKSGLQAYIEIYGKTYAKSFPAGTPLPILRAWRDEQRLKFRPVGPVRGSFGADINTYLSRVKAMVSYRQFAAYLELWAKALGRDRPRSSITVDEIERTMQGWLLAGSAPATVIRRRTVLLSLWNTLDGKQASNPVRVSRAPRAPKPEARSLDYETIARILDAMPDSTTKTRVRVLAYTGLPPGMLADVTPADLNLTAGTVRVRPRRKGAGVEARTLPLTPQGLSAFKEFHAANAYGRFVGRSINRSFQRGAKRAGVQGVHLYDLRHSFGTALYRVTKDLATVARFMLHSTTAMTERYAQAAMQDVDTAAARAMGATMPKVRILSQKPVRRRKSHRKRQLRRVS